MNTETSKAANRIMAAMEPREPRNCQRFRDGRPKGITLEAGFSEPEFSPRTVPEVSGPAERTVPDFSARTIPDFSERIWVKSFSRSCGDGSIGLALNARLAAVLSHSLRSR